MSYENAPATALLASNCLCCGRALVDAASVTAGVGPVCRKKWGYTAISEDLRLAANVLIHEAARSECENARRIEIADELRAMGADVLADKIMDRFLKPAATLRFETVTFGKGKWEKEVEAIVVVTKYNPEFNNTFKTLVDWKDRSIAYNQKGKFNGWAIKPESKGQLWRAIKTHFAGDFIETPDGEQSLIPALAA